MDNLVSLDRLRQLNLQDLSRLRVLVVGDFMLDEYVWGQVGRISPEAPVVVVEVQRETQGLGGAGNVVSNLVGLGAQAEVLGLVGDDHHAGVLRELLTNLGVDSAGLVTDRGRRTTRKTRVIGDTQQVVRIDRETKLPAPPAFTATALTYLQDRLSHLHALVLSDYGKGTLTPPLTQALIQLARQHGLPVVVDPKGQDYSPYARASVITPNRKEAELAVGYSLAHRDDLRKAGHTLREKLFLEALLITLGPEGMMLFTQNGRETHIPAQAREVFDVSGAGDTVVAVMALGLAAWGDPLLAACVANMAAGVVVGKIGTAPIFRSELEQQLTQPTTTQENKIRPLSELRLLVPALKAQGKKVVFTNGCFDLLHVGHIKFLEDSRRQGDCLIVALDSDASVRQVKGEGRPVIAQEQRLRMLAAMAAVDYVTVFESHQLAEILATLKPDILTKGSNYPAAAVSGREIVQGYGGQVVLVPISDPVSVSSLIHQIRSAPATANEDNQKYKGKEDSKKPPPAG